MWDTADYRNRYVGVLGSATAQQIIRKNSEAWRSFFTAREDGQDTAPPGYWDNEAEGRELRTYIRNDQYTLETGERSRVEIPVGQALKEAYGLGPQDRLRLEVAGDPKWAGDQGRLELYSDEVDGTFGANQPGPPWLCLYHIMPGGGTRSTGSDSVIGTLGVSGRNDN